MVQIRTVTLPSHKEMTKFWPFIHDQGCIIGLCVRQLSKVFTVSAVAVLVVINLLGAMNLACIGFNCCLQSLKFGI